MGGRSGSGGSAATGGTTGSGGSSSTGTGGASASGGQGGSATVDAGADVPATGTGGAPGTGGSGPADAAGDSGSSDDEFGNVSLEGKPWIRLCAKDATQAQCCDMLCRCLNKHCGDSPADKANIATCSTMCMKLNNMAMRCHVYHCFESLNPKAVADHASHCGHASNRVGGGGCPAPVYQ
jgi:hypothetical protein